MQSTKGRAEHYIVLCRVDEKGQRFEVQPFVYNHHDKFKTFKAAERHAKDARDRWQSNTWQYRNAIMILVDTATLEQPVISKPKHPARMSTDELYKELTGRDFKRGRITITKPILAPTNEWPQVNHAKR